MANILDIVKEIEKPLLSPQESFFIGSPSYKEAAKETKKAKIETMKKSILEVFGEKSKDGDDLKGLLNSLFINPNKMSYTDSDYTQIRKSARIDPYLRDIKGGKEGEPYYLNPYGSDRSAYDILDSMTFLMQDAEHPYQGSFRGESPAPGGNIGYPSKAQMQPMGKGEAILAKLTSLLGRGK